MLLLMYRTLPPEQNLPNDQRWRCIELDDAILEGVENDNVPAIIRRINDGKMPNVEAIPHDTVVTLVDTDECDSWGTSLKIEKQ